MAKVYINDKEIDIGTERLNLVEAAQRAGVEIPHYCWHPALTVVASCRMCLVEVGEKKPDGSTSMMPKVVPACQTPAKDGTVCLTESENTRFAQKQVLEALLLDHPLDCPVCDKAGECLLQDYSYHYGHAHSRMLEEKEQPPNKPDLGPNVSLFTDRCIMCSRCVRFTREISGEAELQIVDRGSHAEIDVFPGQPLDNKLSSNVVDLCPVGALCSNDFLYKQRVWFLKEKESVCPDCSTGCSIHVDANKDILYRLRPRTNLQAQGHFMCDDGRLGYHYVNDDHRLHEPTVKSGNGQKRSWPEILTAIRGELKSAAAKEPTKIAGMLSPFLTCEEAFLFAKFLKGLSSEAKLYLGPVPVVGSDDTYPKDRRGQPTEHVKFTIRAEKCPNRKGIEAILRHFQGDVLDFQALLHEAGNDQVHALYMAAGYPPREPGWIPADWAKALDKVPLLIVQDLFASPATEKARYVLPASSFAEKEGTFVNHAGLAQAIHAVCQPRGERRGDARIFMELLERRGLFHAPTIRKELAAEISYFAAMTEDLGSHGVFLEKQAVPGQA
ncbi:MAG: molybdopterin-dependent oxidoreductase [Gemmataceae bacterium]